MTSTMPNRVKAGAPTGGQFAASVHAEPDTDLAVEQRVAERGYRLPHETPEFLGAQRISQLMRREDAAFADFRAVVPALSPVRARALFEDIVRCNRIAEMYEDEDAAELAEAAHHAASQGQPSSLNVDEGEFWKRDTTASRDEEPYYLDYEGMAEAIRDTWQQTAFDAGRQAWTENQAAAAEQKAS